MRCFFLGAFTGALLGAAACGSPLLKLNHGEGERVNFPMNLQARGTGPAEVGITVIGAVGAVVAVTNDGNEAGGAASMEVKVTVTPDTKTIRVYAFCAATAKNHLKILDRKELGI
ncbi:MAG: hypothetical protein R3F05_02070 [Planctomycetota bacterium]